MPIEPKHEQTYLWNPTSQCAWVDLQPLLDDILEPFAAELVAAVRKRSPRRVLDVGCGTGTTTLAIARLLGTQGTCVGVDISEPMLAHARSRAAKESSAATFVCDDAQTHRFEPASFDMIVSRFGVMFFDDAIRAFANLRRATTDDADLYLIVWRSAEENPFMTAAERAAAPLLPNLPSRKPDAPGQFAFADPERVRGLLEKSGWTGVDLQPIDVSCSLPESALITYLTRLGPVGQGLHQADEGTRARVIDALRPAFAPYVHGTEVRFNAACWTVRARAK